MPSRKRGKPTPFWPKGNLNDYQASGAAIRDGIRLFVQPEEIEVGRRGVSLGQDMEGKTKAGMVRRILSLAIKTGDA